MQQQPPGWGPPQGYGPPGYPPQGYPPPGYPPPTPPRKKTPVALIAVGALVGICGVCTVIGALVPKPPAPPPTPTTTTQAVAPDPPPTPSAPSVPNPPTAQNPPTPPAAPQAVAPTEQDGRQFIPQTCAEVSHLFGAQSELSELQQEETCAQCLHFGDYQCETHGPAAIEAQRQYAEFHLLKEALESVLALPDAWSSPAAAQLQKVAREVLTEMEKVG